MVLGALDKFGSEAAFELLAALYSLMAFTSRLERVSLLIRLMMDNSTAVC
jgi:hypothetical protein